MGESLFRPVKSLTWVEWLFIAAAWLTLWYFFFNLFEVIGNDKRFDPMPTLALLPIIAALWWAYRLGDRVEEAVDRLDDGAGLSESTGEMRTAFRNDLRRQVRAWSIGVALGIAAIMMIIFAVSSSGLDVTWGFNLETALAVLLALAMIGAGFLIGATLGRLIGYGHLSRVMERNGIRVVSLSTPQSRDAMRSLEGVFWFSVLVTMALCHWFAAWWIMWHAGKDWGEYRDLWQIPFLALWLVSLTIFVFAGRQPILAFDRRLDQIYGGPESRRALDQMLNEAQEDLQTLATTLDRRQISEQKELQTFIDGLRERQFRSPLLNPKLIDGLIAWNAVLILLPWLLGVRSNGI
jgi:hypothetical protein